MKRKHALRALRASGLALLLGLLLGIIAPAAMADALDDMRARGSLGERHDGYVEVRDPSDSEAKKVADDVNAKRKDLYEKRASDQGVAPEDVGRVYATQIMQKAPKGTWFLDENKKWKQK